MAAPTLYRVALDLIGTEEPHVFSFCRAGEVREGVVLRMAHGWSAFANRCPHWNVDLDMGERRFVSKTTGMIVCSNHGALFDGISGHCQWGPCEGQSLEIFTTWEEQATLVVVLAPGDTCGEGTADPAASSAGPRSG